MGDRDVISNKHVVDLGVTAVREAEKRQRRVVSVLSEKQNMENENIVPKRDSESPKSISESMDYLRMDGKRGHVTCGNRLAIERQESFQKFASLNVELLLPSAKPCWDPTRFRMA